MCVNIMADGIETMTQNISIIRRIYNYEMEGGPRS